MPLDLGAYFDPAISRLRSWFTGTSPAGLSAADNTILYAPAIHDGLGLLAAAIERAPGAVVAYSDADTLASRLSSRFLAQRRVIPFGPGQSGRINLLRWVREVPEQFEMDVRMLAHALTSRSMGDSWFARNHQVLCGIIAHHVRSHVEPSLPALAQWCMAADVEDWATLLTEGPARDTAAVVNAVGVLRNAVPNERASIGLMLRSDVQGFACNELACYLTGNDLTPEDFSQASASRLMLNLMAPRSGAHDVASWASLHAAVLSMIISRRTEKLIPLAAPHLMVAWSGGLKVARRVPLFPHLAFRSTHNWSLFVHTHLPDVHFDEVLGKDDALTLKLNMPVRAYVGVMDYSVATDIASKLTTWGVAKQLRFAENLPAVEVEVELRPTPRAVMSLTQTRAVVLGPNGARTIDLPPWR